jgi:hypothetical protein
MSMQRIIGLALLVGGVILIFLGFQSADGLDDQVSEALTGRFTDSTVGYWVVGGICAVAGAAMAALGRG